MTAEKIVTMTPFNDRWRRIKRDEDEQLAPALCARKLLQVPIGELEAVEVKRKVYGSTVFYHVRWVRKGDDQVMSSMLNTSREDERAYAVGLTLLVSNRDS